MLCFRPAKKKQDNFVIIQIVSYRVWDMRESSLNTGISSKNILSTSLLFKKMGGGSNTN